MEALIAEQLDDVDFPFTPIAPKNQKVWMYLAHWWRILF